MKIYTVGIDSHECFGHGNFGTVIKIQPMGAYCTGGFPPCFYTPMEAQTWLNNHKREFYQPLRLVSLELIEP